MNANAVNIMREAFDKLSVIQSSLPLLRASTWGLTGHELGLLYPQYEVRLLEKDRTGEGALLREGAS
jgi:hypothetical protein